MDVKESQTEVATDGIRRRNNIIHAAKETLSKASRLFKKKIPCAEHLLTPRRLWIEKVPTKECDVVIMFPSESSDETLMWFLRRFRAGIPGLVIQVRHHITTNNFGFYLSAPFSILLKAAEEVRLPKRLCHEYGGGFKEFIESEAICFEKHNDESNFFTTQERQSLILHLLHTLTADSYDLISLPGLKFVDGEAIIPKCFSSGIISQIFPIHELPALEKLQCSWVRALFSPQPLDDISRYFGIKITMYFAWLGHYTTALTVPAAIGVIYWIGITGRNQMIEDVAYVLFSIFNVIWATIYLETWKRKSAELAYRWGTFYQRDDLLMQPRHLFTENLEISSVTSRLEPIYPKWKRNIIRYFVSLPIVGICLFFVFVVMIIIFKIQDWWDVRLQAIGYGLCLTYIPKILHGIMIALMDEAYFKLAVWLNNLENHRLYTEYENHLIYKVALFQFVNSFLSLFYIAFYIQDQERLKGQLAALLITRQVIDNLKESAIPYILEQLRLSGLSLELFGILNTNEAELISNGTASQEAEGRSTPNNAEDEKDLKGKQPRNIGQAELESSLYRYDGAFSERLEKLSQLGYVCLFSSAFPLAAFAALLGNLLELRGDAFKLCFIFQRPFGRQVSNIETWQNAMETMGLIAILVNCALIGFSGQVQRMFPEISTTHTILLIVVLEHIILSIRFVIICIIPNNSGWLATELAKVEFLRRESVRRLSSIISPSQIQPSTVIGRFVVSPADGASSDEEQFKQKQQHLTDELLSGHSKFSRISQLISHTTPTSNIQTPIGPKASSSVFGLHGPITKTKIDEKSAETPSSTASESDNSSTFLTDIDLGSSKHLNSPPRGSLSGAERGQKMKEWIASEQESSGSGDYSHHVTIGPHGGIDWARRLGLDGGGRKTSDSEISGSSSNKTNVHRSSDYIVSKELASSSDSDLLRIIPPWSPTPRNQNLHSSTEKDKMHEKNDKHQHQQQHQQQQQQQQIQQYQHHRGSFHDHHEQQLNICEKEKQRDLNCDLIKTSNQADEKSAKEEQDAKKTRVKQSLMKRARSVAIFSLKLKERRAREAEVKAKEAEREARWQQPQACVGGELSCIPIEKLISVDDIATMEIRRNN